MNRQNIMRLLAGTLSAAMLLTCLSAFAETAELNDTDRSAAEAELSREGMLDELQELMEMIKKETAEEANSPSAAEETTGEEMQSSAESPETTEIIAEPEATPDLQETETQFAEEAEMQLLAAGLDTTPQGEPTRDENGYITSTFGYPLKGDPYVNDVTINSFTGSYGQSNKPYQRYVMSDKVFFGEWDAKRERWTTVGKLNYSGFPDLANVENSVKEGDYDRAKQALFDYYLNRERNSTRTKDTYSAKKDKLTADLLLENYMYNANSGMTLLDIATVMPDAQYIESDITDIVNNYLGTRRQLTFLITATNKDGGTVEIASKEAGADVAPYLDINVNGTKMTLTPVADTMIMAGSNRTKNYGSEPMLIARESAMNDTANLVDAETGRIYIKFDVSALKAGDTITGATLNLYGRNSTGDKEKSAAIFYIDDSSMEEDKLTWASGLASVIFSYDQLESWPWNSPNGAGYRYPEELLRFNTWMDKLVKAYNVTQDEKYAYTALRMWMDFINVTKSDPRRIKDLDIAVRSQVMPGYIMQLLESEYMTPDILTGCLKYMWIQGNEFLKFFTSSSNWGSSERMGHYAIALNFQEFTDSARWFSDIKQKYSQILDHILQEDGSSYELALGYTDYTMDTVIGALKIAEAAGIEGESPLSETTLNAIHQLSRFMMFTSMPGYIDNQEGDGYSHRSGYIPKRILYVGDWFGDQELIYGGSGGARGQEPEVTSVLYPFGRKAAMRTDWSSTANYLYASVDGGVGNHAHKDDNNIVVSAYGQYLLVDPLYGSYTADAKVNWLKSSRGHNVVAVNAKGLNSGDSGIDYNDHKTGTRGTVNRWETNEAYDFFEGYSPNIRDARYTRKILFVKPGFWLVTDYLVPTTSGSNKYDQFWHFLPEANIELDEETGITKTNLSKANIQVVPVEKDELSRATIETGWYSEGQGSFSEAGYTVYEKNVTGAAVFNTVLYPSNGSEEYHVDAQPIELSGVTNAEVSAFDLYITNVAGEQTSHYQYYIVNDTSKKALRNVGAHTTDASMLFAELDEEGNTKSVMAQGATTIVNDNTEQTIFKSDKAADEISIKWNTELIRLSSSLITLENLADTNTVVGKNGGNIKQLLLNGGVVRSFNSTSNSIYFGERPNESPDTTPSPSPSAKPSTGTQHGGGGSGGGRGGASTAPVTPSNPDSTAPPDFTEPPGKREMSATMRGELENSWAKTEIEDLYEKGIVSGLSENSFGLEQEVTRAEFMALIVRTLELEPVQYQGGFRDVSSEDWYAGYVQTALDYGLISGYDGAATPEAGITREEMAKILCSAAEKAGIDLEERGDLNAFSDATEISGWASENIGQIVGSGLMNGFPDKTFAPQAYTKREEAFVVIYRLLNKMKK